MKPNVLLVSLDCLRHDFLGCTGSQSVSTPAIDRVAAEGVSFTQALCHTPYTPPSHASLLTGLYPFHHGVRLLMGQYLRSEIATIGSVLQSMGYITAGFPSVFLLGKRYGFHHGFNCYNDEITTVRAGFRGPWRPGPKTNEAMISFLQSPGVMADKPFFIFVHYFDAHDYDPGKPEALSQYRKKIEEIDGHLNRFIAVLKKVKRWENTIAVITADHGDSFGEHDLYGHGKGLYDDALRVPLIVRAPGLINPGLIVDQQVRLIDIAPTIFDLVGAVRDDTALPLDGVSLLPSLSGKALNLSSYAETAPVQLFAGDKSAQEKFTGPEITALRKNGWKYIQGKPMRNRQKGPFQFLRSLLSGAFCRREEDEALYDLKKDKQEKRNLIRKNLSLSLQMKAELEAMIQGRRQFCTSDDFPLEEHEMEAVKERLENLGYL